MTWNPQDDGAQCNFCILSKMRAGPPVPSEFHNEAIGTCLAEAPGETEVERGRPLVGRSGLELDAALKSIGYLRPSFNYVNVLSCRPPDNKIPIVLDKLRKYNKKREREGKDVLPTPFQCCEPRLRNDLARAGEAGNNVIALGNYAYGALTGKRTPILTVRGAPEGMLPEYELGHGRRVLPTMHPAFILRVRRWAYVFRIDLARAIRWFNTGKIDWKPPRTLIIKPSVAGVAAFLNQHDRFTIDVETSISGGPLYNKLRCIGVSSLSEEDEVDAMVIPILSIDGEMKYYVSDEENAMRSMFADLYDSKAVEKEAHNRYFDELVMGNWIGRSVIAHRFFKTNAKRTFNKVRCTLVMDKARVAELPHKLAVVGSTLTEVPGAWKAEHQATDPTSNEALWNYNGIDLTIQARISPPLREAVIARDQLQVVANDFKVQDICKGLHIIGMPVSEKRRAEKERVLRKEVEQSEWRVLNAAKKAGPTNCVIRNPRSSNQLREQLFEAWGLAPATDARGKAIRTKSGAPSASYPALLSLRRRGDLTVQQIGFIDELRKLKKTHKKLSAFIVPLSATGEGLDEDLDDNLEIYDSVTGGLITPELDDIEFEELTDKQLRREGRVIDGRVHASWNVLPKTGRLSCSRPGLQTFPHDLRILFLAPKGFTWVYADKCLVGETKVYTTRGLIRLDEIQDGDGILACNAAGQLEIKRGVMPRVIGVKNTVVMRLANGSTVRCTPEHKWMRSNGEMVRTDALKPNDRLKHVHYIEGKTKGTQRQMPYWYVNGNMRHFMCHHLVATYTRGSRPNGHDVDHINTDWRDWRGENLRYLPKKENRGQGGLRQWAARNENARREKLAELQRGILQNRRSYKNEGNPQFGKRRGVTKPCGTCAKPVYRYKSQANAKTFCSRECWKVRKLGTGGNHTVIGIEIAEPTTVYQLTVDDFHTYVLENGLVSGNSQVELRMAVVRAGAKRYLKEFKNPKSDPHSLAGAMIFGEKFTRLRKDIEEEAAERKKIRDFVKRFVYANLYLALPPTVHRVITSVEGSCQAPIRMTNGKAIDCGRCNPCRHGGLLYADLSLTSTTALRKNWLNENPEIEGWWDERLSSYRSIGYARDPWWGRRCDFLDGEEARVQGGDVQEVQNEVVNWDIQPSCAAMVHENTWRLLKQIRFEEWGEGTGLAFQGHDSLGVLCPEHLAVEVSNVLAECMTDRDDPRAPGMDFISEAAIGYDLHNLLAVGPCEKPNAARKCCWIHFKEAGGQWSE